MSNSYTKEMVRAAYQASDDNDPNWDNIWNDMLREYGQQMLDSLGIEDMIHSLSGEEEEVRKKMKQELPAVSNASQHSGS